MLLSPLVQIELANQYELYRLGRNTFRMQIDKLKKEFQSLSAYIFFDENNYLREQTNQPEALWDYVQKAEQMCKSIPSTDELYFLYGALGYVYRVLNEPKKAITYFERSLDLLNDQPLKKIITLIRLGEAYKYANNHKKALALFDKALEMVVEFQFLDYENYIYQHKGKCLMELGDLNASRACFLLALHIRKQRGNQELIDSTQKALTYVEKRLAETK